MEYVVDASHVINGGSYMDLFQAEGQSDKRGNREDAAQMRALAARYAVRGTARLCLPGRVRAGLSADLDAAARLRRSERASGTALALLDAQASVIEACAARAASDGGARLPAWAGRPRLHVALSELCGGEARLTQRRLTDALIALDALQPLTEAELWETPAALRIVISEALGRVAAAIVARAEQRARAVRWARRPIGGLGHRDDVFLAQALKQAGEAEKPAARRRLDAALARRALSPRTVVARAQAGEAGLLMRLENLLDARRMADALNWQACFLSLSRVEQALFREATGTYPRMDDDSRAAVRREVARIARALKLPEPSVARAAVDAARTGEGIRREVCWWLYDDAGRRALLDRLDRGGARLRKMTPDPSGHKTVLFIGMTAAALALALSACAAAPWLWPACAVPGWGDAGLLAGRL